MLNYQVIAPRAGGDYVIAYPTPGVPHVLTVAGSASTEKGAQDECARLSACARLREVQVVERRAALVREADMIACDLNVAGRP
jgi:hypothetical protein